MEKVNHLQEEWTDLEKYLEKLNIPDILSEMPKNNSCQLRVSLTQLCNENCFFCHNEWNQKSNVSFDDVTFKKIIDVMVKYNIKQRIRFTGWEPLLYEWIEDLIKYVKNLLPDSKIWLTTNGLLLEEKARSLSNAGLDKITISIHSLKRDRYKEITNVDWLKKVLKWLEKLRKINYNWEVSLNSVIWKNNIDEVRNLDVFCSEYGYKLKLLDILPVTQELQRYSLSQREIEEISSISKTKWIRTQNKCIDCQKKNICWWEAEYLRVSPDWILSPCLSLKEFDIDLKKIKSDNNLEKWILLWIRRLVSLSL